MPREKKLLETGVFQVEASTGFWVNIKAVHLAEGEEWDPAKIRAWRPKIRFTTVPNDDDERYDEDKDDPSLKR